MIDFHQDYEPPESPESLHAVDARLRSIAESAAEKPAWYEAWTRLTPDAAEEQRLAVYQAIRDSGLLPARPQPPRPGSTNGSTV
jgi:hypothetical protein